MFASSQWYLNANYYYYHLLRCVLCVWTTAVNGRVRIWRRENFPLQKLSSFKVNTNECATVGFEYFAIIQQTNVRNDFLIRYFIVYTQATDFPPDMINRLYDFATDAWSGNVVVKPNVALFQIKFQASFSRLIHQFRMNSFACICCAF